MVPNKQLWRSYTAAILLNITRLSAQNCAETPAANADLITKLGFC